MGMPKALKVTSLFFAGGVVPPFYAVLIGIAVSIPIVLGLGLSMTRLGKTMRRGHRPTMPMHAAEVEVMELAGVTHAAS